MPAAFGALIALVVLLRLAVYAAMAVPYGGLVAAMCRFDCGWYERIALSGYGADADWPPFGSLPHWAFFPLYPLLLRAGVAATDLPARLVGLVLSSLCLAGFMAAGAAYLRTTRGAAAAPARFVVLAAVVPCGLFFTAVYTEALYALVCTLALLGLARGRPLAGALAAGLASAARPTGILLAPVFAVCGLLALRRQGVRALLPAMLAPLGLVGFMAAQWYAVGDPLTFSHVQAFWNREWRGPQFFLWNGLAAWDWNALLTLEASQSFQVAWALLGLAAAAWLAVRRRWAEAWLLAGAVLLPASTGLDSLPRFVACNPVFLFAVHDLLAPLGRRVAWPALAVLGAAGLLAVFSWMQDRPAVF